MLLLLLLLLLGSIALDNVNDFGVGTLLAAVVVVVVVAHDDANDKEACLIISELQ